jgi:arylsulfatase A-like enzyme
MRCIAAAGVALLGGLVTGTAFGLDAAISGVWLLSIYAASAALLGAVVSVPAGLAAFALCGLSTRRLADDARRGDLALAAALVASVLAPVGLVSLRWLHKSVLADAAVLSLVGLGMSGVLGAGLLALAVALTILTARSLRGGFGPLARAGCAAATLALAVVVAAALEEAATPSPEPAAGPNVLLISLDSLRADVFYEYVDAHARPPLREFVAGGRRHENAHTSFSHSLPSHTSMMSGLYPPEHGALFFKKFGSPVGADVEMLAERLAGRGFQTTAIVSNWWLGPPYGGERGFGSFVNYGIPERLEFFDWLLAWDASVVGSAIHWFTGPRRGVHENSRLFLRWLDTRDRARPFFAFLHYMDMHPPNDPPAKYRERFCNGPFVQLGGRRIEALMLAREVSAQDRPGVMAQLRNLYFADMARLEDSIEPVITRLLDGAMLRDTLVFLVSDHGENLYEKANEYTKSHVYHTSSRVPFVLRAPGDRRGARSDALVSLVDVAPTAYAFLDVDPPANLRGRDLLGAPPRDGSDWIYMQGWDTANRGFARMVQFADGRKWIRDGAGRDELYDLNEDPHELTDLAPHDAALASGYRGRFQEVVAPLNHDETRAVPIEDLDPEMVEKLTAMGYLQP